MNDVDAKRDALMRVLEDDKYAGSARQKAFLSYVVEENIAGRGDLIRGKTIAQDVYGRDHDDQPDAENIVRVDARRLRQSLDVYYETSGRHDPLRIWIDTGTYNPRFEPAAQKTDKLEPARVRKLLLPTAIFAVGVVVGGILAVTISGANAGKTAAASESSKRENSEILRRVAIYDKSPAALQAKNLAEHAKGLLFPLFDLSQQKLVAVVFTRVMDLDESYFGGYAGAAHSLANLSVLNPPGAVRNEYLEEARKLADTAINLSPTEAWSQSARAWVAFAEGDTETALRISERAVEMDSKDGYVLDYRAIIALFAGQFEEAIRFASLPRDNLSNVQRFSHRNIIGAANYHLGNFEESFASFEAAKRVGEPFSAASIAYQAAGLSAMGRADEAKAIVEELRRAWPKARVDLMLRGIYADQKYADDVVGRLEDLGWEPNSVN